MSLKSSIPPGLAADCSIESIQGQKAIDWNSRFLILLGLVTLFRFAYLVISPLSLAADEAYYWDWSRQLAWGYFSKPPMVAWIIGLFSRAFGASTAVVRLPSVILATISSVAVFLLARKMFGARTAFWAAAVGMASPGAAVLGYVMTIDAPLMCFWALGLYLFWAGLEKKEGGFAEWLGLGVVIGLGLLSKQVMAGFIGLMFVFVAVSKEDRRLLTSPRLYLVCLLGLCALIPDVLWNAGHGWITIHHTESHFAGSRSVFILTFLQFVGGQIGVISPITWLLIIGLSGLLIRRFKSLDRRVLYLLTFSIVPLAGIAALSLRQKIQPNWPAPVYTAAMVLLAAWGCENISAGKTFDAWRPYFKKGITVGAVMALLTYGLPILVCVTPGPWARKVIWRVEGWGQFGIEAGRALSKVDNPQNTFLLTFDRQLAAELAFYVPDHPRVYVWRVPGAVPSSQYDIWAGPKTGLDALILCPEGKRGLRDIGSVSDYFREVRPLAGVVGGDEHRRYKLFLGKGLKKWPGN
jgi:4-amino-4-deoxy-L-arabinose transferase-like glycosyltransferase